MELNPQIIIPLFTALTGLILLCAGGRLLRPAVGLAGGLFGAGCGLLLAPSLSLGISPLIIVLICGIIAALITVWIAKFSVLFILAVGFAIAAPVITWHGTGLGNGRAVLSNVIDAATDQGSSDRSAKPSSTKADGAVAQTTTTALGVAFGMLTQHATETIQGGTHRANAAWKAIPVGPRLMLTGAAIAGLLLGLLVATFMPQFSASLVTACLGSVLLVEALRNGVAILWSQQEFAPLSSSFLLLLCGGLSIAGLGLQLTLFRRPPTSKARA